MAALVLLPALPACGDKPTGSRNPAASSCAELTGELANDLAAELAALRTCETDADCGRDVPAFGSCGCSHNPVVRKNADTARYFRLFETVRAKGCEAGRMMGTCDCPPVAKENGGFACRSNRCEWNLVPGSAGGVYRVR